MEGRWRQRKGETDAREQNRKMEVLNVLLDIVSICVHRHVRSFTLAG